MAIMCIILTLCAINYGGLANSSDITTAKNGLKPPNETSVDGSASYDGPIYFQVSIWARINTSSFMWGSYTHICSGSLVTPKYVVSAAECVRTRSFKKPYHVYAVGGTDHLVFNPSTAFVSPVKGAKINSFYKPNEFDNGAAVLQLVFPVPSYNFKIGWIPMRSTLTKANEKCQISGWVYQNSRDPNILGNTTVTILENKVCDKRFRGRDVIVTSHMFCGVEKHGENDSCKSELGGPVVCNGELSGIILWGNECGRMRDPGVYVSVAHYKEWILDTIKQFNDASTAPRPILPTEIPQRTDNPTQRPFPLAYTLPQTPFPLAYTLPQTPFPPGYTLPQTPGTPLPSSAIGPAIHILTYYAIGLVAIQPLM